MSEDLVAVYKGSNPKNEELEPIQSELQQN